MPKRRKVPLTVTFIKNGIEKDHRFEEDIPHTISEKKEEHYARRQVLQRYLARGLQVKKIVIDHAGA